MESDAVMKDQRYEAIKLFASKKKTFTIEELATQLNVSITTIRRDVAVLAKEGSLKKYYGKIVWNGDVADDQEGNMPPNVPQVLGKNRDIEIQLARAAADLVQDNDYIFIESGAFILPYMAKFINKKNVTAVTSDLQIAISLLKNERLNTIVLGGHVWRGSYLLYGDITERALMGMRFNKYFTLPGTITDAGDIMYFDAHTSGLRHLLRSISEKTIVIVERKRVGRSAFLKIGTLNECSTIVTDCPTQELPPISNSEVTIISLSPKDCKEEY